MNGISSNRPVPLLFAPVTVTVNSTISATVNQQNGTWSANVSVQSGTNQLSIVATDKFNRTDSETRNFTVNNNTPLQFSYDANGNMTSDGTWDYSWDEENRLIQQIKANTEKVEYKYDGLGRMRIKKSYAWDTDLWDLTSELRFAYDNNCIIAELDGSDSVIRSYVWGLDIDGGLGTAGGVGGLLLSGDELAYYDGNGNITAMVDAGTGNVTYTCEYSPFGEVVSKTGSSDCPFGFSTQYTAHGLVHYLYRKYSPEFCRWLSRDPIEESGGNNLYGMCSNDALNKWDYLGMDDISLKVTRAVPGTHGSVEAFKNNPGFWDWNRSDNILRVNDDDHKSLFYPTSSPYASIDIREYSGSTWWGATLTTKIIPSTKYTGWRFQLSASYAWDAKIIGCCKSGQVELAILSHKSPKHGVTVFGIGYTNGGDASPKSGKMTFPISSTTQKTIELQRVSLGTGIDINGGVSAIEWGNIKLSVRCK